jgi:uncharacterized protein YbcV (DUF1398 family)
MNQTPSKAIENLQAAQKRAMAIRPKVGGFPVLAEVLRQAGVRRNTCDVDFGARTVTYCGCKGERYVESYPQVSVDQ